MLLSLIQWSLLPCPDAIVAEQEKLLQDAQEYLTHLRDGEVYKYLKDGIQVRHDRELHSKILVGDNAAMLGSFNMTYQSMFDNQENSTYSRSEDYAKFFLAEWEEAVVPGE